MAKKLRCWKKINVRKDFLVWIREDGKQIDIRKRTLDNKWQIRKNLKGIKTGMEKPQALKFAKSYMKKHDVCKLK